jgi:ribose transport system substrate-binding protein
MNRSVTVWIALTMAAGFVHAPGARAETIAVFTKNTTNPFSLAIRTGANTASKKLNVDVVHFVPTTPDHVLEQSKLVDDALVKKPDAIVFDPVDDKAMVPSAEKINAANIPMVDITDRSAGGTFVSYVLPDDHALGLETARYLFKALEGKGNVVILEGIPTNFTAAERLRGFNEAAKEFPNIKVLASKPGNYQRKPAQDLMEGWIKQFPQIDGVVAANDSMAAAAVDILDKRNRKALVVGINGSKEAVELIKSGKMLATGEFNGFVIGCLGTEIAARVLRKQPVPKELTVKPLLYDKTNYEKYQARIEMRECPTLEQEASP